MTLFFDIFFEILLFVILYLYLKNVKIRYHGVPSLVHSGLKYLHFWGNIYIKESKEPVSTFSIELRTKFVWSHGNWFQDYIDQKLEVVNENIMRHHRYMKHRASKVIWSIFFYVNFVLWKNSLQSYFFWKQYSIPLCYRTLAFAASSGQSVCWKHFIENRILNGNITLKNSLIRPRMKYFYRAHRWTVQI